MTEGGLMSVMTETLSAGTWQYLEYFGVEDPIIPTIIAGLFMSVVGMLLGILTGRLAAIREGEKHALE